MTGLGNRAIVTRVKSRTNRRTAVLPIGRTAKVACQIEAMRSQGREAAHILVQERPLDEYELEECARLDDALAQAQYLLKSAVGRIIMSRLKRRSRLGRRSQLGNSEP